MTTGKDTHGATPSQLATIKLQKIPAADGSDVNDVQPIEAGKLWSDRPALLLVVRRTVSFTSDPFIHPSLVIIFAIYYIGMYCMP